MVYECLGRFSVHGYMRAGFTSFWSLLVSVVGRRWIPKTWRSLGEWSGRRFRLRGNRSRRRSTWLRLEHHRHRRRRTSLRSLGRRFRNRRSSRIQQPGRRYRFRFRIWNAHKMYPSLTNNVFLVQGMPCGASLFLYLIRLQLLWRGKPIE